MIVNAIATPERAMLVDSVRRFLQDQPSIAQRAQAPAANNNALWRECAEMGWLQACVPEQHSGLGLGILDAAFMAEEMGRHLLSVPVSRTMAIAAILSTCSAADTGHDAVLAPWLQGDEYLAMVAGEGSSEQAWAEYAMANCQALELSWVDGQLRLARYETTDAGHGIDPLIGTARIAAGEPEWTASITCPAEAWQTFCLQNRALLLAELLGASGKALDEAVAYACERQQFDKAIGVNQAIKHRLADNWMAIDNARLALHDACTALDNRNDAELPMLMAELLATEAAASTTAQAIQTFGAMGFTWECPMHFYLKRVKHMVAVLRNKHDTSGILDKVWELA